VNEKKTIMTTIKMSPIKASPIKKNDHDHRDHEKNTQMTNTTMPIFIKPLAVLKPPRRPLRPYQRFFRQERATLMGVACAEKMGLSSTHAEADEVKKRKYRRPSVYTLALADATSTEHLAPYA
jgi:hypothetical protein